LWGGVCGGVEVDDEDGRGFFWCGKNKEIMIMGRGC